MGKEKATVAFQGELGAFSEIAARTFFPETLDVVPQPTFSSLFETVDRGTYTCGIVPIENTLMGSIHETYDLLLEYNLKIVGEIKLRIVHNLIVNLGVRLNEIRQIFSQPPALAQCSKFIRSLKCAEAKVAYDTAGAVKYLKETGARNAAAIASEQAAINYGLEILRTGIENNHQNYTRFIVIAKEETKPEEPTKTSIVFDLKNTPGTLFKSLSVFAQRDINLLKIESRPLDGKPWEYAFYLDFEGHPDQESCLRALENLREIASFVKILGSYKQGASVENRIRKKGT